MAETPSRPVRKRPADGVIVIPNQSTVVYDTVCTKSRSPWLATDVVHQQLREVWTEASAWKVGKYVIMPDHVHYFAAMVNESVKYENWIRFWKSQFTKSHGNHYHRWQSNNWDTRMRSEDSMEQKWQYIRQNPVRAGLVSNPDDWPFQGTLFELRLA